MRLPSPGGGATGQAQGTYGMPYGYAGVPFGYLGSLMGGTPVHAKPGVTGSLGPAGTGGIARAGPAAGTGVATPVGTGSAGTAGTAGAPGAASVAGRVNVPKAPDWITGGGAYRRTAAPGRGTSSSTTLAGQGGMPRAMGVGGEGVSGRAPHKGTPGQLGPVAPPKGGTFRSGLGGTPVTAQPPGVGGVTGMQPQAMQNILAQLQSMGYLTGGGGGASPFGL
jgi:pilus assembly protein FimV